MSNLREQMEVLAQGIATSARERKMAVDDSKAQTARMLQAFGRERAELRRSLRRRLAQSTEALVTFVVSLRASVAKERADFAKAHHHMAKTQRAGLAIERRNRSREVAKLMNGFHMSRGEMARKLAKSLAKSTQEIKSQVSGLNRFSASPQKIREDTQVPRPIPNNLLAAQAGGPVPVPSALGREPEERPEETTVAKAARTQGKPREK